MVDKDFDIGRVSEYISSYGRLSENSEDLMSCAMSAAMFIKAHAIRPDFILGHHIIRLQEEIYDYENIVGLARITAQLLNKPYGMIYEDEGVDPVLRRDKPEGKVLIVDGAARTGDTIIRTADFLRKVDPALEVNDALVLMVRYDGKKLENLRNRLMKENICLHYLSTSKEIIIKAHQMGRIPDERFEMAMRDEDFQ